MSKVIMHWLLAVCKSSDSAMVNHVHANHWL